MGNACHKKFSDKIKISRDYDENEEIFRLSKKIEANPQNFLLIEKLGCLLFSRGNLEESEALLNKAYKNGYKAYESIFILGNIEEMKGNMNEALKFYEESYTLNPRYLGCLRKLIEIHLSAYHFDESIKYCLKYLNINNKSAQIHVYLALNLLNKKKIIKANEHIQLALDLDQNSPRALNCYANILEKMGKRSEAVSFYIKAIENSISMNSEFKAVLHYNLAINLFYLDKVFFALKELDRALIIYIQISEKFIGKGFHLFFKDRTVFNSILDYYEKNYSISQKALENALLSETKNFIIFYYLGEIAEKLHQIDKAIFYFQKTRKKIRKSHFQNSFVAKYYMLKIKEKIPQNKNE